MYESSAYLKQSPDLIKKGKTKLSMLKKKVTPISKNSIFYAQEEFKKENKYKNWSFHDL